MACAGAFAPLGLPLALAFESLQPGELPAFGPGEAERVGAWDALGLLRLRALGTCFRWAFDGRCRLCGPCLGRSIFARCGLVGERLRFSSTPQVGVQGDTHEGVKADPEVLGAGSGGSVEGVGKS